MAYLIYSLIYFALIAELKYLKNFIVKQTLDLEKKLLIRHKDFFKMPVCFLMREKERGDFNG